MALQHCCCCGLRGGALAVGITLLVLSVLHLLSVIITWAIVGTLLTPDEVASYGVKTPHGRLGVQVRQSAAGGIGVNFDQYDGSVSSSSDFSLQTPFTENRIYQYSASQPYFGQQHIRTITYGTPPPGEGRVRAMVLIPQTVFAVLSLLFNSLLVHGTRNSSSCAVLAWLIYNGVLFALLTLGSLGLMVACFVFVSAANSVDGDHPGDRVFALIFGITGGVGLLLCALLWYLWAVVLAFQQQLHSATASSKRGHDTMLQEASPTAQCTQSLLPTYAEAVAGEPSAGDTREDTRKKSENFRDVQVVASAPPIE